MPSTIRAYDEAVLNAFSNIEIDDGVEKRYAQTVFAISDRKSVKLDVTENQTPVYPLIVVTRTGLTPKPETYLINTHINRRRFHRLSTNLKNYNYAEAMEYDYSYNLEYFALEYEMFNQLTENLLYLIHKKHYVTVHIEDGDFVFTNNANISNISYTDNTSYDGVQDTETRIFHGTISFKLAGCIINYESGNKSILHAETDIRIENEDDIIKTIKKDAKIKDLEMKEKNKLNLVTK